MARPLPKDLEQQIADTARKSEVRSVGLFCFILGLASGVGLYASFSEGSDSSLSSWVLAGVATVMAVYWFAASRRNNDD